MQQFSLIFLRIRLTSNQSQTPSRGNGASIGSPDASQEQVPTGERLGGADFTFVAKGCFNPPLPAFKQRALRSFLIYLRSACYMVPPARVTGPLSFIE